jgi:transposase
MTFPNNEIVVVDIAGRVARVRTASKSNKAALARLGFDEEGDYMTRAISDTSDRCRLLENLLDLDALFSYGRDWSPSELVEYYRDQGFINRPFRVIAWSDPNHYTISIQ